MIRFCDSEVYCVSYEQLNRRELLNFFFKGNMDEIVCVMNSDGSYRGRISYYSLINCDTAADALLEDYVELNQNIWKNARTFFQSYKSSYGEYVLLPVLDKKRQLVCFAYEDHEANREIRMLRELNELKGGLQFVDVYPQYSCVKIYGFNELAWYFSKYLDGQGICVQTEGSLWESFKKKEEQAEVDYKCYSVYAEGIYGKNVNWTANLLRSVSPEFECIDCIYEANIKEEHIKNAATNIDELLDFLRKTNKEIAIIGIDTEAQDGFNYLKENDIEVSCFVGYAREAEGRLLFGRKVLNSREIRDRQNKMILINCHATNSAWGSEESTIMIIWDFAETGDCFY